MNQAGTLSEARERAGLPRKSMIYNPNSLEVGALVVAKHLRVREDVTAQVDAFWKQTGLQVRVVFITLLMPSVTRP